MQRSSSDHMISTLQAEVGSGETRRRSDVISAKRPGFGLHDNQRHAWFKLLLKRPMLRPELSCQSPALLEMQANIR